ncbi:hypothetical protein Mal64_35020 [Pseudobythopirellula maris]|uniref:DUF2961 domain-containing protein n=1 Tax=Pseudobythopirellula maris TaxID=2527991 RepID=A0A5C5ZJQ3_9BACT|nr:glycoside hydrolase family 172 protein [Pseudobythopirellula maris]TWT86673.1 hypothetical protein Mal64_35020 [Pseudobythopirellula maris]
MNLFHRCFLSTALLACASAPLFAQPAGPLGSLERLQPGRSMRSSSSDKWDWRNGNSDNRQIAPGETLVIADLEGPGRIQHIWNTLATEEQGASRLLVVRMYWDGEQEPSVEAPLGDFFVIGHGVNRPMESLPVMVSSEGRSRNCYWPMPFRKSAKVTITNEGKLPVGAFYYYVDWQKLPSLPEETPYFHAQYRQEYPTTEGQDYLIADIEGRGHYVGTVLNVRQRAGGWFGEGDDFFYIDGEEIPSIQGTGTEDYFCDAWGFREFDGPYYGVPIFDHYQPKGLITAYRWHVADPVSFEKSLRMEIEHKGAAFDEEGELRSGYEPRVEDFASVAYWYQLEPHKPFPAFPKAEDRLYRDFKNRFESELYVSSARVSRGDLSAQEGGQWSNNAQLFWRPPVADQSLELPLLIRESGSYKLTLVMSQSWDYGKFEVLLDGESQGEPVDLYSKSLASKKHFLPPLTLEEGEHTLTLRNVGKSDESGGYFLGIDMVIATQAE